MDALNALVASVSHDTITSQFSNLPESLTIVFVCRAFQAWTR